MTSAQPLTLGTAGHIDHGKTALVAALTGRNTDRLPAEKARGISIELGYAPLRLTSGRRLSVVDVPGHERFVRTMVAGATGIDLYLMVVAADDGVMPQTREHAAVLAALGVATGVVAVTKADLADPARAGREASELLPQARSCRARRAPARASTSCALPSTTSQAGFPPDASAGEPLLHVDRAFTIRGAGTVVTGTLWAGRSRPATRLELLPAGTAVRVRSVQVHDEPVERADAGQRVARQPRRRRAARRRAWRRDRRPWRSGPHAGARLRPDAPRRQARDARRTSTTAPARRRRASPTSVAACGRRASSSRLMARAGDRVVVRSIAPPDTHRRAASCSTPPPGATAGAATCSAAWSACAAARRSPSPSRSRPLRRCGTRPPRSPGPPSRSRSACAPPATSRRTRATSDADDLAALRAAGRAVRVGRAMYAHPEALAAVRARVEAVIAAEGAITLARLRDELQTSRKFAQAHPRAPRRRACDEAPAGRLARAPQQIKKPGASPTTGR